MYQKEVLKRSPDTLCHSGVDVVRPSRVKEIDLRINTFRSVRTHGTDEADCNVVKKEANGEKKEVKAADDETMRRWKWRRVSHC